MRLSGQENLPNDPPEQEGDPEMRQASQTTLVDPTLVRPKIYYNDGPFEAPSSSDDEAESLLGTTEEELEPPSSPGMAELGGPSSAGSRRSTRSTKKTPSSLSSTSLKLLVAGIVILVGIACVIGVLAAITYQVPERRARGFPLTMDHIFNGSFNPEKSSLHWVPEAGDGVFSTPSNGFIKLIDLKTGSSQDLVRISDIQDEHGNHLRFSNWQVSPDMKYILVKADHRKQWRWSSFGNYYVHNIETGNTHPVTVPTNPSRTAYATWSPTGQAIAYVTDNDLYILPSASPTAKAIRVTSSGNASLFHGVPDWVYEEEVFSADYALWWSPDSRKVAFLVLDETQVPEYSFPIYNPTEDSDAVIPYTKDVVMKYPKPGYPNPLVSVHVFDLERYLKEHDIDEDEVDTTEFPAVNQTLTLDWESRHDVKDSIVMEVAWVSNSTLILKEVNRNADDGNVVLFDLEAPSTRQRKTGRVVRKLGKKGEEGDDGWIDHEHTISPLLKTESLSLSGATAYLDIVPTPDGYNHIALFSPADSDTPHFLTSGEWEVVGGIKAVDIKKGLVYFISTKSGSTGRHIYSVPIPTIGQEKKVEPLALTDDSKPAYHQASFSPEAGFYLHSYDGPDIPSQKVVEISNSSFSYVLTDNELLKNVTEQFEAPIFVHSTFVSDGYELNVKEIRPPRMDDSGRTKYPVLFKVYGGPGSQQVDQTFPRTDWANYVACGLKYIVVIVDGRGTGFKGRKLRNPVKGNLGFFETIDQIEAAKEWAKKPYVDAKRIGIWGWSYGGFMSSKIAEANAGIHSLAMAVAPVTSWRLYDSIYTERYMNLPDVNPGGYINASISNVTGFNHINYLVAQGSGDDNVHFANTAHLLDMFTQHKVRGFRFRMFTDSDHSIFMRGGNRELYEFLTAFLVEKWGVGPKVTNRR